MSDRLLNCSQCGLESCPGDCQGPAPTAEAGERDPFTPDPRTVSHYIDQELARAAARRQIRAARDAERGYAPVLYRRSQLAALPSPEWVVDRFVARDGNTVLYGRSGAGKTFTLTSMACAIATGTPWFGAPVIKGQVVYVLGEGGGADFNQRIAAWEDQNGILVPDETFASFTTPFTLSTPDGVDALLEHLRAGGITTATALFVDTLRRNSSGNENQTEIMGAFVDGCDTLRRALGCAVIVAHHPNKNDDLRGSITLESDFNAKFELRVEDNPFGLPRPLTLHCHKQRTGPPAPPTPLVLRAWGASCVVESPEGVEARPAARPRLPKPSDLEGQVLDALLRLGDPATMTDILTAVDEARARHGVEPINKGSVYRALRALSDQTGKKPYLARQEASSGEDRYTLSRAGKEALQ